MRRPKHATVVAYVALAVAMTGTASAATGGTFLLGKSNSASSTTTLSNSKGTALSLKSKTGTPPLAVNSSTKVSKLNADQLDGLSSGSFQRRVSGSCAAGSVMTGISSAGQPTCVALDGRGVLETKIVKDVRMSNLGNYAECPAGWKVLGGGFDIEPGVGITDQTVRVSKPVQDYFGVQAWYVRLEDPSSPYGAHGDVWAVCGRVK